MKPTLEAAVDFAKEFLGAKNVNKCKAEWVQLYGKKLGWLSVNWVIDSDAKRTQVGVKWHSDPGQERSNTYTTAAFADFLTQHSKWRSGDPYPPFNQSDVRYFSVIDEKYKLSTRDGEVKVKTVARYIDDEDLARFVAHLFPGDEDKGIFALERKGKHIHKGKTKYSSTVIGVKITERARDSYWANISNPEPVFDNDGREVAAASGAHPLVAMTTSSAAASSGFYSEPSIGSTGPVTQSSAYGAYPGYLEQSSVGAPPAAGWPQASYAHQHGESSSAPADSGSTSEITATTMSLSDMRLAPTYPWNTPSGHSYIPLSRSYDAPVEPTTHDQTWPATPSYLQLSYDSSVSGEQSQNLPTSLSDQLRVQRDPGKKDRRDDNAGPSKRTRR